MKRIKPSALILMAVTLSVLGLAMGFVGWADGFAAGFGWQDQTLIVGGLLVVMIGISIWLLVYAVVAPASTNTAATTKRRSGRALRTNAQRTAPLRLAHLQYRLDDPLDPQAFNEFLDQVLFIAKEDPADGHYHTPIQLIEDAVVRAIRELEQRHQDRITVEVKFSRGSLALGLTFLAAYEFLAQYHDFVESITLIQQQLRRVIGDTGRWYYLLTDREMQVEADVAIESPAALAEQRAAKEAIDAASRSASLPLASSTTNEVRINIYPPSFVGILVGSIMFILIIIIFVAVALSLYCQIGVASGVCQQIWQSIVD